MRYKNLYKSMAFCLMTGVALLTLWNVLKGKWLDGSYVMEMFYEQPKDSIDVVFLGSSRAGADINPAVLWEQYGIAAYNLWGSEQPMWNSYYYLKECLEYQTPKLIVLEALMATEEQEYKDDSRIAKNTFGMKPSANKWEAVRTSAPPEKWADFLLEFPVWHTRYNEIGKGDFKVYGGYMQGCNFKAFYDGIGLYTQVMDVLPDVSGIDGKRELTDKTQEYLIKIMETAGEEDIPIMLIVSPYAGITREDKEIYNKVEEIAEAYGTVLIDFNEKMDEIGLEGTHDFAESSHLNLWGAEKYTSYLGKVLKDRYVIPDRRGNPNYGSWDFNAGYYRRTKEELLENSMAVGN